MGVPSRKISPDVGGKSPLQIICGAPNVKPNIFVPVAKIGATLNYSSVKIKKTKIRGVDSFSYGIFFLDRILLT